MIRLVAALIAALALAGCGPAGAPLPIDTEPTAPSSATSTPADVAEPARIRVPQLGIDSSLTRTGMDPATHALLVPPVTEPMQASWFSGSGRPGTAGYPGIILGHVSGRPAGAPKSIPGVFAKLSKITAGAMVYVDRADGTTATFVVTKVETYAKSAFPVDKVYADTARPEIRLITCGGEFDASVHSYKSNVVAYAELAE